jgi:hypothetical protein
VKLLAGPDGCNFRQEEKGPKWDCDGYSKTMARAILAKYFSEVDIEKTMSFFEDQGGFCDCEIIFNVSAGFLPPKIKRQTDEIKEKIAKNSGKPYFVRKLADSILNFSNEFVKTSKEGVEGLDPNIKSNLVAILRQMLEKLT